jgi:hypothetical protein
VLPETDARHLRQAVKKMSKQPDIQEAPGGSNDPNACIHWLKHGTIDGQRVEAITCAGRNASERRASRVTCSVPTALRIDVICRPTNVIGAKVDAGQFKVGQHGLCWVHAERLVHKLDTFTDQNRAAQSTMRAAIWQLYGDLKAYRCAPTAQRKADLEAEFDRVFTGTTGFISLDRLLARLHANKAELNSGCHNNRSPASPCTSPAIVVGIIVVAGPGYNGGDIGDPTWHG